MNPLMPTMLGDQFNQHMLANAGMPGMAQEGSAGLPVPGGLDYTGSDSPFPSYLSPTPGQPTAPFLPYTPPQMQNVGITSFDEIDNSAYQGVLERLFPERLGGSQSSSPLGGMGPMYPGDAQGQRNIPAMAPANPWTTDDLMWALNQGPQAYQGNNVFVRNWMNEQGLDAAQKAAFLDQLAMMHAQGMYRSGRGSGGRGGPAPGTGISSDTSIDPADFEGDT